MLDIPTNYIEKLNDYNKVGEMKMPLINCKDCNSEISDSAESCPKCGAPYQKPSVPMKNNAPTV